MLELYHDSDSIMSFKVRFCLAEKGLDWTSHPIILGKFENLTADYLEINPSPLAPTHMVKYCNIKKIEEISNNRANLYRLVNGANKKLRLPIAFLTDKDKQGFLEEIRLRADSDLSNS